MCASRGRRKPFLKLSGEARYNIYQRRLYVTREEMGARYRESEDNSHAAWRIIDRNRE